MPAPRTPAPLPAAPCACLGLLAAGCAAFAPEEPAEGHPNVVIVDVDSLRADRAFVQRDGEPVAPAIAALAERGVTFENAFSQGGWTMPGLAALLSGRAPVALRVQAFEFTWLPPQAEVLPEILALYGYQTAFYGNHSLAASRLVTERFQVVLPPAEGETAWVAPLTSWIERDAREPFFALLHDLDLHLPIPPVPEEALHRFSGPSPACPRGVRQSPPPLFSAVVGALGLAGARRHVVEHYDATLAWYDRALGGLFEALEERGIAGRTLVVLSSNHGEELGEHGSYAHGLHYDTVLRVPLVLYDPRRPRALGQPPRRIDAQVQTMDLAPTLLELCGVPADRRMEGRSLAPLLEGGAVAWEARDLFSLSDSAVGSLRTAGAKLLLHREGERPPPPEEIARSPADSPALQVHAEYYRLDPDPAEQVDLAWLAPEEAAPLRVRLDAWLAERARAGQGEDALQPDPALAERLRLDGYWQHVGEEAGVRSP